MKAIKIEDFQYKTVQNSPYLDLKTPTDNNCDGEIRARLLVPSRAYFSLQKLFHPKHVTVRSKLILYEIVILLVLMYSWGSCVFIKQQIAGS